MSVCRHELADMNWGGGFNPQPPDNSNPVSISPEMFLNTATVNVSCLLVEVIITQFADI